MVTREHGNGAAEQRGGLAEEEEGAVEQVRVVRHGWTPSTAARARGVGGGGFALGVTASAGGHTAARGAHEIFRLRAEPPGGARSQPEPRTTLGGDEGSAAAGRAVPPVIRASGS